MIYKKTKKECSLLKEGGKILMEALYVAAEMTKEADKKDYCTGDFNRAAEKVIASHKAKPAFLNFEMDDGRLYPTAMNVSVNEEVVHGVPGERKLKEGDLVKLDLGVIHEGLYTDAAITVPVGKASEEHLRLIKATKKSLNVGIQQLRMGNHLGDYGFAVQKYARKRNYEVIKILGGHGVGYDVHEEPFVPNFGKKGRGLILEEGMVLALEPLLSLGSDDVYLKDDGFTYATIDDSWVAHFEQTVAITDKGPEILTESPKELEKKIWGDLFE